MFSAFLFRQRQYDGSQQLKIVLINKILQGLIKTKQLLGYRLYQRVPRYLIHLQFGTRPFMALIHLNAVSAGIYWDPTTALPIIYHEVYCLTKPRLISFAVKNLRPSFPWSCHHQCHRVLLTYQPRLPRFLRSLLAGKEIQKKNCVNKVERLCLPTTKWSNINHNTVCVCEYVYSDLEL